MQGWGNSPGMNWEERAGSGQLQAHSVLTVLLDALLYQSVTGVKQLSFDRHNRTGFVSGRYYVKKLGNAAWLEMEFNYAIHWTLPATLNGLHTGSCRHPK
jgi:hypothetical protein